MRFALFLAFIAALLPLTASSQSERGAPSILWMANSPSEPAKARMLAKLADERGIHLESLFISGQDAESVNEQIPKYDMVLMDYVYPNQFMEMLNTYRQTIMSHPGIVFPGMSYKEKSLTKGLTTQQAKTVFDYYDNGGQENFGRLFDYLNKVIFEITDTEPKPPILFPEHGIYHPDYDQMVFGSLQDYLAWRKPAPGQPIVGIGFHQLRIADDMTLHIDDLIHRLEAAGAFPVPFYDPNDAENVNGLLTRGDKLFVDTIISFTGMYTDVRKQKQWLTKLDLPFLQANLWRGGYVDEWYQDEEGFPFVFMATFFTLAEIAGRIDPTTVAAKRREDERYIAIPEQMEALAERAINYVKLRAKPNKDKQVAFVVWNSPEGEENFSASYLNVPLSLADTFAAMREAGYTVPEIDDQAIIENMKKLIKPYYRTHDDAMLRMLVKEGLAEKVPLAEYKQWLAAFPETIRKAMDESWGPPDDTYLTLKEGKDSFLVVPRLKLGNITLLPQPLRGGRRDAESDIFHDKKVPLHHAYRGVYYHLVHRQTIDAFVHFGTHGSQEWLGGKERGPWVWDDTQSTIGNVPVVYPYNVANTGEALIAKRRGRAVIVSHNAPPFAPAGLYGDLIKLHELVLQMEQMEQGRVKEGNKKAVVNMVKELGFEKDMGMDEQAIWSDFDAFEEKLHEYLHDIASTPQPLGMQTFGSTANTDHILLTILQILGEEYMAAVENEDPEKVLAKDYNKLLETDSFTTLKAALAENKPLKSFDAKARSFLQEGKRHYANFMGERETEHLLAGLSGRYVPTGTGNDPLRNPDSVPTGRNLYAFDPTKIPTKAAWEAGKELAQGLIGGYKEKHGMYPDKLAFSMWSTETFKHFGVIEGEILYALGVRPVWNDRDQVTGVEIIPLEELGRPRVDTLLSITGLYRDNLPQVMNMLQNAINKVAQLKEPQNHVYQHAEATKQTLIGKGLTEEEAARFSRVRLFGVQSGVYGTNLPEATLASDTWDDDTPMAEMYLARMGYIFGSEEGTRNLKLDNFDLFAENLKGTKAAVLSRSTNNHGILSLDHPFEYLGGIGMAVRYLDGETPELYIADLRNTRRFRNDTVADFLAKELRTRYYHPRWITEMMDEGYSGALEIVDVVNNFWGWNVMDRSSVRADQWQELFEIYVEDKLELGIDEWFDEIQPAALAQIAERMLEAVRKDYWDASEEAIRALVETYLELANKHDIFTPNEKFKEYVGDKATGYGLDAAALAQPQSNTAAQTPAETETVEGVQLQKQEPDEFAERDHTRVYLALILLLLITAGFFYETLRKQRFVTVEQHA